MAECYECKRTLLEGESAWAEDTFWFFSWEAAVEAGSHNASALTGKARVTRPTDERGPYGQSWRLTFVKEAS